MKKSAAQLAGVTSEDVLPRDWTCVAPNATVVRVPCRLQESVTCGLVSLLIVADGLLPGHGKSCAGLLELAVARGFSKSGEMFSCALLAALAVEYWDETLRAEVVADWNADTALDSARNGRLMLVPYDCSTNFEPGCFGGEKAHWCVVAGTQGEETAVCVQPKSRRVGLWSLSSLLESNRNLLTCRVRQKQGLAVPDDLEALRGKAVVLSKQM
jgi:hypothetical protein